MIHLRIVAALLASSLAASVPLVLGQQPPTGQQPPAPPAKPQVGQASSQAELDEFNKLRNEADNAAKKRLIDEFLKKYPESGLAAMLHEQAAYLAMEANDFNKLVEHGEKSLEIMPGNYVLMTQLGSAYARRNMIDKAESNAEQAMDLIVSAQKPPQATEEQWAQGKKMLLGTNYSALALVHLRRAQSTQNAAERKTGSEKTIAAGQKALEQQPTDDVTLWAVGTAYVLLNDYANAESNLAKAVVVDGIVTANARSVLEDMYKQRHKNSLDGLDKVLAKAKKDLGLP